MMISWRATFHRFTPTGKRPYFKQDQLVHSFSKNEQDDLVVDFLFVFFFLYSWDVARPQFHQSSYCNQPQREQMFLHHLFLCIWFFLPVTNIHPCSTLRLYIAANKNKNMLHQHFSIPFCDLNFSWILILLNSIFICNSCLLWPEFHQSSYCSCPQNKQKLCPRTSKLNTSS